MKSTNLIIVLCAIIVLAGVVSATIFLTSDSSSNKDNNTIDINNSSITSDNDSDKHISQSDSSYNHDSSSKSDGVVSEEVKYNGQADDGSYYREVTYSDGGFRQYNTSSGELIGSSYESDQKNLPSME